MSIGNLKTEGGKGTNWPWQYKMLKGLQGIIDVINSTANGSEYEAKLVTIDCPPGPVPPNPHAGPKLYLEVRVWNTVSGGFTDIFYYLPGDLTQYLPAQFLGCTITYLETGDATEATLQAIEAINTDILADTAVIETNTTGILADTAAIETNTDELVNLANTPHILRQTAVAVPFTNDIIMVAVKSISFYNASATQSAQIEAGFSGNIVLKVGETLNFDAGGNGNSFPATSFTYDPDPGGIAGDLVIIYVY
jgi:hypothetical protein